MYLKFENLNILNIYIYVCICKYMYIYVYISHFGKLMFNSFTDKSIVLLLFICEEYLVLRILTNINKINI